MATSTFDRRLELNTTESVKKLMEVMQEEAPVMPLSQHPFSSAEREKAEFLLCQFLSRK